MHSNRERLSRHANDVLISGYQGFLEQLCNKGWPAWFCTAHFNHLSDNRRRALAISKAEIERIYRTLLTDVIRRPRNLPVKSLPVLVGCPDSPVAKRRPTARLTELLPNNGMHWHLVLFLQEPNRLQIPLDQHVAEKQEIYRGGYGHVARLTVQPGKVSHNLADYLLKHVKRGTYTWDDVLILPRSSAEIKTSVGNKPQ